MEHWAISECAHIALTFFEDQYIAFHGGAGKTHLLAALAGDIIQVLQAHGPLAVEQINQYLIDGGRILQPAHVRAVLDELEMVSLAVIQETVGKEL